MKHYLLSLFCAFSLLALANSPREIKINTQAQAVTIFLDGAQVSRSKTVAIPKGESLLQFTQLSPFIQAKSIRFKSSGDLRVLSINSKKNYDNTTIRSEKINTLEDQQKTITRRMEVEKTHLAIIAQELDFLTKNKSIGGRNDQLTVSNLKETAHFFSEKYTQLKFQELKKQQAIDSLKQEAIELSKQIRHIADKVEYPTGEIFIKINASQATNSTLELSYTVDNVNWFPSYDIKASNINNPLELTYKAVVKQDCKEDWKNVRLTFSSSNPKTSNIAPQLKNYFLDYNIPTPSYSTLKNNTITGRITDDLGAILGVTVNVEGTSIGTVSDMDGHYSITVPNHAVRLKYAFIGYKTITKPIYSDVIDVKLSTDATLLEEVAIVGSTSTVMTALQGRVAGMDIKRSKAKKNNIAIRGVAKANNQTLNVQQKTNQTSVEFTVNTPYTIKSTSESYTVDLKAYEIPASYQYYCVPKVDKDAFLIAYISEWEQYKLLDGEANIFFEDTYIGKTLLDLSNAKDTLELSLGRDKNVVLNREKIKDYRSRQFIGTKRTESRTWTTSIKNNKSQEIKLLLLDQIPVSTNDEIEVSLLDKSGAKVNAKHGKLEWDIKLKPGQDKIINVKYEVEYPKNRVLNIE